MDLSKLDELKLLMQTGRDFQAIWEYFLDNFAEKPEFLGEGSLMVGDDHLLCQIVEKTAMQVLRKFRPGIKQTPPVGRTWIQLPEHHFIHGGMMFCGHLTNVLYFDDIKLGLLFVQTNQSEFVRFSLAGPPTGSLNRN
jgi:hypothetical protein